MKEKMAKLAAHIKVYSFVDNTDIDEIVDSHLKNGQPVTRLIMPPEVGR